MATLAACCANPFESLGFSTSADQGDNKSKTKSGGAANEKASDTKAREAVKSSNWTKRSKEEVEAVVNQWEQYVHERAYKVSRMFYVLLFLLSYFFCIS